MTEVLSEKQIKKFEDVYRYFDKDHDNAIDSNAFSDAVSSLGYVPKNTDIVEITTKHNNKLRLEDFIVLMGRNINNNNSEDEIKEALALFEDGNGNLNEKEFIHSMKTLGKHLKPKDINEFLGEFERKDKKIPISDFKSKLLSQ